MQEIKSIQHTYDSSPFKRSIKYSGRSSNAPEISSQLQNINWTKVQDSLQDPKISPGNKAAVGSFTRKIVDETLKKIEDILKGDVDLDKLKESVNQKVQDSTDIFGSGKADMNHFSNTLAKTILKATLSDLNLIDKNEFAIPMGVSFPPAGKYFRCPPLGSPIMRNRTLVSGKLILGIANFNIINSQC